MNVNLCLCCYTVRNLYARSLLRLSGRRPTLNLTGIHSVALKDPTI